MNPPRIESRPATSRNARDDPEPSLGGCRRSVRNARESLHPREANRTNSATRGELPNHPGSRRGGRLDRTGRTSPTSPTNPVVRRVGQWGDRRDAETKGEKASVYSREFSVVRSGTTTRRRSG
jgi:hypothetical protein